MYYSHTSLVQVLARQRVQGISRHGVALHLRLSHLLHSLRHLLTPKNDFHVIREPTWATNTNTITTTICTGCLPRSMNEEYRSCGRMKMNNIHIREIEPPSDNISTNSLAW